MSRGKTNRDFIFRSREDAEQALKYANSVWNATFYIPKGQILQVREIETMLEPSETSGEYIVTTEDGEYMVNNYNSEWEDVA
jgi:hypothetical protein